ncbi:hypothetical protein ACI3L1_15580 [Deinococcus sp. SM5_A1]|uniref:hypothetical protein n=1 Tax=Deinococcus sp. SM5_A1 TaxID=3379094 RepID=UPI00385EC9FC
MAGVNRFHPSVSLQHRSAGRRTQGRGWTVGDLLKFAHSTASQMTTVRRVLEETGAADIHLRVTAPADLPLTPLLIPATAPER